MKKTYIAPEMLSVELNTKTSILQASLPVNSTTTITDANQILTKENNSTDKGVWDEEW
jgi:hypothetical protein